MRIATWNINGIKSRLGHVIEWCRTARPDVLCLQETKCPDTVFPHAKLRAAGFEHIAAHGEKSYNGVAILSKFPADEIERQLPGDADDTATRFLAATIRGLLVINVYVPHGTAIGTDKFQFKLDWIARLRRYLDKHHDPAGKVILCGDLNVAPHEMDVWNPRLWQNRPHFSKPEREAIHTLRKWGFVDVFRQFNGEPGEYSWWDNFRESSFTKNRGLRIDHIWTSPPMAELCTDCWIDCVPRGWEKPSDHAPVVAEFMV